EGPHGPAPAAHPRRHRRLGHGALPPLLPRLPGLPPRARAARRGRAERHAAQAARRRPARGLPRARRRAYRAAPLREPAGPAPEPAGDEPARAHAPLLPGRRPGRHPRGAPRRRRARARRDGDPLPRVPVRGLLHRRSRRAADRAGAGAGRSRGAAAGRVSLRPATRAEPLPGEAPWFWDPLSVPVHRDPDTRMAELLLDARSRPGGRGCGPPQRRRRRVAGARPRSDPSYHVVLAREVDDQLSGALVATPDRDLLDRRRHELTRHWIVAEALVDDLHAVAGREAVRLLGVRPRLGPRGRLPRHLHRLFAVDLGDLSVPERLA